MDIPSQPPSSPATSSPEIHSFGKVHCAQGFDIANMAMVEVEGGYVAIDAGTTPNICEEVDSHWRQISGGSAKALVLTHFHTDHNGGAAVYAQQDIPIWGQKAYLEELDQTQLLPNAYFSRGAKQFGWLLDEQNASASGIGPVLRIEKGIRPPIVVPNRWVDKETTETIGGETFVFRSSPGETFDHLSIWMPERRVLFAADNIYQAFPNLYAIRGVAPRPIREWIESLDAMRRLDPLPELLILGHTAPVVGEQNIYELLTIYRDAIAFVHDSVVRGMNAGLGPDDLVQTIDLPDQLREHPYLVESYGTLGASIRAIYTGYMGWFDGDAANLVPATGQEKSQWLIEELGGKDAVVRKIESATASGNTRRALWMAQALHLRESKWGKARKLKADLLEQFSKGCENPLMRNWALTEAADLQNKGNSIRKPKINGETIMELPVRNLLQLLPARLNPKRTARMESTLGFDVTDSNQQFTFIVRKGVGELANGLVENPDLTIRATERNLKKLFFAGEANPLTKEFWKGLELITPQNGILSPFRRLLRLVRLGQLFIRP